MKEKNKISLAATEHVEGDWTIIEVTDSKGNLLTIKTKNTSPEATFVSKNQSVLLDTIDLGKKLAIFEQRRKEFDQSRKKFDAVMSKFNL